MAITSEQLKNVSDGLQRLNFDLAQDRAERTVDETCYLKHYGLTSSQQATVQHRMGKFLSQGFHIACQYWVPENPKGTYYIVHGYFDHTGLYEHLIHHLLKQGYAVVAFDLPGHGLSSGERVTIESFDHYVDVFSDLLHHCETHFPKPWKAVGQSTGGAVLIKYILGQNSHPDQNDLQEITVLAPLIRTKNWKIGLLFYKLFHRFLKRIKRKFHSNTADEKFNHFLENDDPLQSHHIPIQWITAMKHWAEEFSALPPNDYPLKVIQGDCDNTVDWQYNLEVIRKNFHNAEIDVVEGVQHHMVNEIAFLREKTFKEI